VEVDPIIEHKGLGQSSIVRHGPEIVVGETNDKLNKQKGTSKSCTPDANT
jgi:hypothetical protein